MIQEPKVDDVDAQVERLLAGVTFQPQYTFPEKARVWADTLRSDLFRTPLSPAFIPRGFRLSLDETSSEIRITHTGHEGWHVRITASEVYFHAERPPADFVDELIDVQVGILKLVLARLAVEHISTIGIKFVAVLPMGKPEQGWPSRIIALHPIPTLVHDDVDVQEVAFRLSYVVTFGTATLQASCDPSTADIIIDLDYFNRDPIFIETDAAAFMRDAQEHLLRKVIPFLLPLTQRSPDPGLVAARKG